MPCCAEGGGQGSRGCTLPEPEQYAMLRLGKISCWECCAGPCWKGCPEGSFCSWHMRCSRMDGRAPACVTWCPAQVSPLPRLSTPITMSCPGCCATMSSTWRPASARPGKAHLRHGRQPHHQCNTCQPSTHCRHPCGYAARQCRRCQTAACTPVTVKRCAGHQGRKSRACPLHSWGS